MKPTRGLDAFDLSIDEPIYLTSPYGHPPWKALFSADDVLYCVQYEAHYLLAGMRTTRDFRFSLAIIAAIAVALVARVFFIQAKYGQDRLVDRGRLASALAPVSYTHLDVADSVVFSRVDVRQGHARQRGGGGESAGVLQKLTT